MRLEYAIAVVLVIGSCATQKISPQEAQKMSHLSLKEFLMERFGKKTVSQSFFGGMTTGMQNLHAKVGATPEEQAYFKLQQDRREHVRADGSFLHSALYDGSQQVQLMRPMGELREFCQAQGGQFTVTASNYDPEEVDRVFELRSKQAVAAGVQADAQVNAVLGQEQHLYALQGASQAANLDRQEDRRGAAQGYRRAVRAGAFGDGTCSHPARTDANWTVNVRPVYFEPYNPQSSIKLHEMDLRLAQTR